ncbi:MAG: DGQHR domain-containing protein [Candidatus Marinimicrobia bacterium]|nr:DGQHR domain-containing protein [Candidatus Neomarinimicrobiota bacterium]
MTKTIKSKKKIILTPEQKKTKKEQRKKNLDERKFKIDINTVFKNAGFNHIVTRDEHFTFKEVDTELDNIFIYENIVVFVEDTCSTKSGNIRDHLLKKATYYKYFIANKSDFIAFLDNTFDKFREVRNSIYDPSDIKLVFVYASKYRFDEQYKNGFRDIIVFLDYYYLCYFLSIAKNIQKSSRFELFKFLGLSRQDIGINHGKELKTISGSVLPESPSGFPKGFKVITFYIDPETLIELSYVMRKDGWQDNDSLYQRMIIKNKIFSMREYLSIEKRVFINNIIVTLPSSTKFEQNGNVVLLSDLTKTEPIELQIPKEFNSIGIIDGQHRVFAYHEGQDKYEKEISKKRKKQNLLVTGIIYPEELSHFDQTKFEAKLFLEINDKQNKTKSELKQAIETIVNPFSVIAISKSIILKLGISGALTDLLEVHFFDKGKIKTASIVSYGLRHIVKLTENDSLFSIWTHPDKLELLNYNDRILLNGYIDFCTGEINNFLNAFKKYQTKNHMWISDQKSSRVLTTTTINGIIFCLRKILQEKKVTYTFNDYEKKLENLNIDFHPDNFLYKSSHWKDLGEDIYKQCFL